MVARPSRRTALIAAGTAVIVAAIGGTAIALSQGAGSGTVSAPPTSTATGTTGAGSASPSPSPRPSAVRPAGPRFTVSPLTGSGPVPKGPVIAVKIDDTENGRPQLGIDKADVIYIEQAEGGLTRLVAVFASKKPTVEAVRSVRASDPELLSQFGRIALVASGGGGDSLTTLDHSIVKGVINDRGGAGFSRDDGRGAPYNLRSDLAALDSRLRTAGVADIGFAFAVTDPRVPAGRAAPTIATSVGNTPVTFHYDSAAQVYVRTLDGQRLRTADGASFAAKNVIIQFCQVSVHPGDVDVMGNPSQYTHTVGSGRAVLFRNGHRVLGRWSRKSASSPTLYTDAAGVRLRQAPGPTIVVLAANGAPF